MQVYTRKLGTDLQTPLFSTKPLFSYVIKVANSESHLNLHGKGIIRYITYKTPLKPKYPKN